MGGSDLLLEDLRGNEVYSEPRQDCRHNGYDPISGRTFSSHPGDRGREADLRNFQRNFLAMNDVPVTARAHRNAVHPRRGVSRPVKIQRVPLPFLFGFGNPDADVLQLVASLAIFQFMWVWNDLLIALIYLGGYPAVAPMTVTISNLVNSLGSGWQLLTAAAFISMMLPLLIFIFLQRYFVRGILAGSVKG